WERRAGYAPQCTRRRGDCQKVALGGEPLDRWPAGQVGDEGGDGVVKPARVEVEGLPAGRGRREVAGAGLEPVERLGETVGTLVAEQEAGRLGPAAGRDDRLGRAAAGEGDDRGAARLCLDRDDAEVLFAGEEQRPAAAEVIADRLVGLPAEEGDGRSSE